MTDRYAVVGNPVVHSLSPEIHAAFARQTGQDIEYTKLAAPLDDFAGTVRKFREEGGCGINVTVPFKHEAWSLADIREGDAANARAVNTMVFAGGKIVGHNTDGAGLLADLEKNLGFAVRGRRVLIMGAGGATYGVMLPLLKAQPAQLVVANRTVAKARDVAAHFGKSAAIEISAHPYTALSGRQFDLVINATSAGLQDAMPPLPAGVFAAGALAYDMVYNRQTPFMRFAQQEGARTADGLGMLVEQAAVAFYLWRGVRPASEPAIAMLRGRN